MACPANFNQVCRALLCLEDALLLRIYKFAGISLSFSPSHLLTFSPSPLLREYFTQIVWLTFGQTPKMSKCQALVRYRPPRVTMFFFCCWFDTAAEISLLFFGLFGFFSGSFLVLMCVLFWVCSSNPDIAKTSITSLNRAAVCVIYTHHRRSFNSLAPRSHET